MMSSTLKFITKKWNSWSNFGVSSELSPSFAKRIVLTNQISITITGIVIFFGVMWGIAGDRTGVISNTFVALLYLGVLWLNKNKHFHLSRFFTIASMNFSLFIAVGALGKAIDTHVNFFTLAGIPLILYERRERLNMLFGVLLPVSLFAILSYYHFHLDFVPPLHLSSLPKGIEEFTHFSNFAVVIFSMFYLLNTTEKAEQQLNENQKFLRSIIEYTPMVFFTKDREGNYLLINPEFENTFNIKQKDILGKSDDEVFGLENNRFCSLNDDLVYEKNTVSYEAEIELNHIKKTYLCTKFPILNTKSEVTSICAIATDITEKVEAQRILEEKRSLSMYSMKMTALGEMAAGMSHEINNPLTAITLMTNHLSQSLIKNTNTPEQTLKMLGKINATAIRISNIINALIVFSQQTEDTAFIKVELSHVIEDTLKLCRERIKTKGINLIIQDHHQLSSIVNCRPAEISQVLMILLNNAFDAVEEVKNPWIKVEINSSEKQWVEIAISDNGLGVPSEIHHKIFQPFFTTKAVDKGAGLGLSIASGIMQSHHGKLYLNRDSEDTKFVLQLPIAEQIKTVTEQRNSQKPIV